MNSPKQFDEKKIMEYQPNILVISGGGPKGIAFVGILSALEEKTTFNINKVQILSGSSIGGVIGGIAINYMLDNKKPLFSIVKKDDELHISSRGTQYLVNNGLDLGFAMRKVSKDLDGNGGGHKIAAGATIQIDRENDFLEKTDLIISKQMREIL